VGYWVDHISRPVRYQQAVERVVELGGRTLVEFGPDLTLTHLASSMGFTSKGKLLRCVDGMAFYSNLSSTVSGPRYPVATKKHRMLQEFHYETFSSASVFSAYLHKGIIHDWLGDFVLHGSIVPPSQGQLWWKYFVLR